MLDQGTEGGGKEAVLETVSHQAWILAEVNGQCCFQDSVQFPTEYDRKLGQDSSGKSRRMKTGVS